MTMFGAIYYIVPRITGIEFCSRKSVGLHFWLAALGILIYALPLALGGIQQGMAMNDRNKSFVEVMAGTLTFLRISTTGDLLMLAGHLVFLLNLAGVLKNRLTRSAVGCILNDPKPAGVAS